MKHTGTILALNKPRDITCLQEDGKRGERKDNNLRFPMSVLNVPYWKVSISFLIPLYFKINLD